jgi:hypothetical protein
MARGERWQVAVAILGVVGSVISIFVFTTGINSLREVVASIDATAPRSRQPEAGSQTTSASAMSTSQRPHGSPARGTPDPPATPSSDVSDRTSVPLSDKSRMPSVTPAEGDPGRTSRLEIVRAELNGRPIEPSAPVIVVAPDQPIQGIVQLRAYSTWTDAAIAFGMTPSWGRHEHSVIDYGGFFSPVNGLHRDVTVNLQAPSAPGEYYMIFAFRGEFTAAQVFSATNWTIGNPRWGNGDDIASWSSDLVWEAIRYGRVAAAYNAPERAFYVPASAIIVRVE